MKNDTSSGFTALHCVPSAYNFRGSQISNVDIEIESIEYIYICMYVCIYIIIYIFIYKGLRTLSRYCSCQDSEFRFAMETSSVDIDKLLFPMDTMSKNFASFV